MELKLNEIGAVVFGGISGCLAGIPAAAAFGSSLAPLMVTLFTAMGLMVGYKKRKSRPFFYLSLFTTLALTTILAGSGIEHP